MKKRTLLVAAALLLLGTAAQAEEFIRTYDQGPSAPKWDAHSVTPGASSAIRCIAKRGAWNSPQPARI
jgi:hypothetical protein